MEHRVPLRGRGLAAQGFTLVEIMVVVLIISMIVAISIPNFMRSRAMSRKTACLENLRVVESAKEQFAMAANRKNGDSVAWDDLVPAFIKTTPSCPTGGQYTLNPVGTDATCSLAQIGHHQ